MPLAVTYSPYAATQLGEIRARAEANPRSAHGAMRDGLRKLINEVVAVEDHAFGPATALRSGLSPVRRAKMGRLRLFFLASREHRAASVLMVGYRKAGDKNDAYEEIARRIRRGEFDAQFDELGIKKPDP